MAPPPGMIPRKKPRTLPRRMAPMESRQSLSVREKVFHLGREDVPLEFGFEILEHLGDPEQSHDRREQAPPHPIGPAC